MFLFRELPHFFQVSDLCFSFSEVSSVRKNENRAGLPALPVSVRCVQPVVQCALFCLKDLLYSCLFQFFQKLRECLFRIQIAAHQPIVIAVLQCPAGIQLCGNCTVVEAEPIGRRDPLRLLVCFRQQSAGVEIQILPRMELLLFPISLRKKIVAGCIRVQQFKKSQCLPAVAVGRRQAPALRRDRAVLNGRPQRDGSQLCATGPGVAVQ